MDRSSQGLLLIVSPMVGSRTDGRGSIAEISGSNPNLILTKKIDSYNGLEINQCKFMKENIGLDPGTKALDQMV